MCANRCAIEIRSFCDAEILADENALAVIKDRRAEVETELERSRNGHGDPRKQDIELAALQCGKALLWRGIRELDLVGIAEYRD
ncbi:hypothetical protein D3C80_1024680 [compost metagenome]